MEFSHNLGLALVAPLKIYSSLTNRLILKVIKFQAYIPAFRKDTGENLIETVLWTPS